jgi:hypothetical protein
VSTRWAQGDEGPGDEIFCPWCSDEHTRRVRRVLWKVERGGIAVIENHAGGTDFPMTLPVWEGSGRTPLEAVLMPLKRWLSENEGVVDVSSYPLVRAGHVRGLV